MRHVEKNNGDKDSMFNKANLPEIETELKKHIGKNEKGSKHRVGRARDITMTIQVLDKISEMEDYNIVKYSLSKINSGNLVDHYNELQKIHSIGPKISSFYLRDLICLYGVEDKLSNDELALIQPIDTWVKQVAEKVGIIDEGAGEESESIEEIRNEIFDACQKANVSIIKFNQGAWYLGANSFDVLIDNLENLKP